MLAVTRSDQQLLVSSDLWLITRSSRICIVRPECALSIQRAERLGGRIAQQQLDALEPVLALRTPRPTRR